LPICNNTPPPTEGASGNPILWVEAYGAFFVRKTGNGKHTGQFLYDYSIRANGKNGWRPGSTSLTTIRLRE
jgi:hypothetical protein